MMQRAIVMAVLILTGCATTNGAGTQSLNFRSGVCFGACPVYSLDMAADGRATFHPERFTVVTTETAVTLPPAAFADIIASLAPWRPAAGVERSLGSDRATCTLMATDHPGYSFVWDAGTPRAATLNFYSGCHDAKYAPLQQAIRDLPATTGITALLRKPG
jgi:hypothetical protein